MRLMFSILVYLTLFSPLLPAQVNFTSSDLPIVVINTNGQIIRDTPRIVADMGIIDNGPGQRNNLTDTYNNYSGKISIEIRGASSQNFPKKQYALETQDEAGQNRNVSLLGMPEENDWVLYAPYSDKSLMRNVLAYTLSNAMGLYASRTRFCELVLNGQYQGVYVLMEKIKRDKNRLDIARLNPDEISGDDLTGGYIFKIDKSTGDDIGGWISRYKPYPGSYAWIFYQYHYPKFRDIVPSQENYIQSKMNFFETTMFIKPMPGDGRPYADKLAVPSFVDYFILNELAKNVDGYRLSTFMYKDRDDRDSRIFAGPIWDFNLAFGNADYYHAFQSSGWQVLINYDSELISRRDDFQVPFWWERLSADDWFMARVRDRWTALRQVVLSDQNILGRIDSLAAILHEAQARNFERWPVLGKYVWPNYYVGATYDDELVYMKGWIINRMHWIDEAFTESESPSVPAVLIASEVTSSSARLDWAGATDNAALAGYDIFANGKKVHSTNYTQTVVRELLEDTPYSFVVRSRDYAGNLSAASPAAEFRTRPFTANDGAYLMRLPQPPVVDGQLDALWQDIQPLPLNNLLSGSVGGDEDLQAAFRVGWTAERLFVLIEVDDDQKVRDDGTNLYRDDGVELYIDLDDGKTTAYGEDDFKYRFVYGDSQVYERVHGAIQNVQFAFADQPTGYNLEISIPWCLLGFIPGVNDRIGFELQVNDDDDGGDRDAKIAWWGEQDNAYQSPAAFGTLKLKDTVSQVLPGRRLPHNFVLLQNYPNPFNPITTIRYQLPAGGKTLLQIFDTRGRLVATLVSADQPPGKYSIDWDATGFASGVYFYRLASGRRFVQTRKLVLLR